MAGHETQTTPAGGGSGSAGDGTKPAAPGDVSFELPSTDIKGVIFEPQAIYAPSMMLIYSKKKVTLEQQRAVLAKTKDPVQHEAQAAVLATMLYDKSKAEKDDAAKAKWWQEALQALNDAAAASKEPDDITLRLIGRYALLLNDFPTAEKVFSQLVTSFPKDKDAQAEGRTWWGYSLLMQHKNADALEVVKNEKPSDKQPELAYVIAWSKFRAGDEAGAFQAILLAAKGWGTLPALDAVDRDVYLLAGRGGVPMADAITALTPLYARNNDQMFDMIAKLGLESYQYAGRWSDGIAALEKAIGLLGAKLPPEVAPKLRYTEASYALRLDDPAQVTKFSKLTLDALTACGAKCDKDKDALVETVLSFARLMHVLYASAHDDRYYQPAHDLYLAVMPFITTNKTLEAQVLQQSTNLDSFKQAMKPNAGTHAKDQIAPLLDLHNQEIQACYELALAQNPKVGGTLVIHLESDQTGVIKGVSTEPKAGLADLSLVASCAADRAKQWHLPKIANGTVPPRTTRIKLTYSLAPHERAGDKPAAGTASGGGGAAPAPPPSGKTPTTK
jgi:hypothetical protein